MTDEEQRSEDGAQIMDQMRKSADLGCKEAQRIIDSTDLLHKTVAERVLLWINNETTRSRSKCFHFSHSKLSWEPSEVTKIFRDATRESRIEKIRVNLDWECIPLLEECAQYDLHEVFAQIFEENLDCSDLTTMDNRIEYRVVWERILTAACRGANFNIFRLISSQAKALPPGYKHRQQRDEPPWGASCPTPLHLLALFDDDAEKEVIFSAMMNWGFGIDTVFDDDKGLHNIQAVMLHGSPLHATVRMNSKSAVRFLLFRGADPYLLYSPGEGKDSLSPAQLMTSLYLNALLLEVLCLSPPGEMKRRVQDLRAVLRPGYRRARETLTYTLCYGLSGARSQRRRTETILQLFGGQSKTDTQNLKDDTHFANRMPRKLQRRKTGKLERQVPDTTRLCRRSSLSSMQAFRASCDEKSLETWLTEFRAMNEKIKRQRSQGRFGRDRVKERSRPSFKLHWDAIPEEPTSPQTEVEPELEPVTNGPNAYSPSLSQDDSDVNHYEYSDEYSEYYESDDENCNSYTYRYYSLARILRYHTRRSVIISQDQYSFDTHDPLEVESISSEEWLVDRYSKDLAYVAVEVPTAYGHGLQLNIEFNMDSRDQGIPAIIASDLAKAYNLS